MTVYRSAGTDDVVETPSSGKCSPGGVSSDSLCVSSAAQTYVHPQVVQWGEADVKNSLAMEQRMTKFFAEDAAAAAADPEAAEAAAAEAESFILEALSHTGTVQSDGAADLPVRSVSNVNAADDGAGLRASAPRVFRIDPVRYYAVSALEERLPLVGADNVGQLCKSILLENTKHNGRSRADISSASTGWIRQLLS